jgi:hypothetical protein
MPSQRSFRLEKIHPSIEIVCPHCTARIEPGELICIDWEHMECPWCEEKFISFRLSAPEQKIVDLCANVVACSRDSETFQFALAELRAGIRAVSTLQYNREKASRGGFLIVRSQNSERQAGV